MKDLQKLMDDIREWSDATFGENRVIPQLHHLIKEVPEVIKAIEENPDTKLFGDCEFADCFMLLLDAASHHGMKASDLIYITGKKLELNKKRKWKEPDENGVVEHIAEPEMKEYICQNCESTFKSNTPISICPNCYI